MALFTCESCAEQYERSPSKRGAHDYCSRACYHKVRSAKGKTMLALTCDHCGVDFTRPKMGQRNERFFCSQKCYLSSDYHRHLVGEANGRRNPDAKDTRPCGHCDTPVTRYVSNGAKTFYCSQDCHYEAKRKAQVLQLTSGGYVRIFVGRDYPGASKSGHVLEHRKVMQDILGRSLMETETVHHANGDRSDNRPENLELWSHSHPKGQRVEDKIQWAREILALYE